MQGNYSIFLLQDTHVAEACSRWRVNNERAGRAWNLPEELIVVVFYSQNIQNEEEKNLGNSSWLSILTERSGHFRDITHVGYKSGVRLTIGFYPRNFLAPSNFSSNFLGYSLPGCFPDEIQHHVKWFGSGFDPWIAGAYLPGSWCWPLGTPGDTNANEREAWTT